VRHRTTGALCLTLRAPEPRESVSYDAVLLVGLFYIARSPVTPTLDALTIRTSSGSSFTDANR